MLTDLEADSGPLMLRLSNLKYVADCVHFRFHKQIWAIGLDMRFYCFLHNCELQKIVISSVRIGVDMQRL